MKHQAVFDYLRSNSPEPLFYDAWADLNELLFDNSLNPIPIVVGLSRYGRAIGFCAVDHIALQPSTANGDKWLPVLAHEMCHQADHQDGFEYKHFGRLANIHNTPTWCDRINQVMPKVGDKRFAAPYKRNREGEVICTVEKAPEGLQLIEYDQLKHWEPAGLMKMVARENFPRTAGLLLAGA